MERTVDSGDARITYLSEGRPDGQVVLFINSIGATRELWGAQIAALAKTHRLISYDARGHGRSSVPAGDYTLAQLGADALAVLDAEQVAAAHVCGISLGGITAMWLGIHAPSRVRSLTLANTAARIGTDESWAARMALVRERGMRGVADVALPMWFTDAFRDRAPATLSVFRDMIESCSPEGYLGCCAALRDADLRERVREIACPVLCIAAPADRSTPPAGLEYVHEQLPGSALVLLDTAHISNVERPAEFNQALSVFLAGQRGR